MVLGHCHSKWIITKYEFLTLSILFQFLTSSLFKQSSREDRKIKSPQSSKEEPPVKPAKAGIEDLATPPKRRHYAAQSKNTYDKEKMLEVCIL